MDADLEALFNRVADGLASEADEQRLGELLRCSAETRRACRQFMALHSALHWDYVAALSPETPSQRSAPDVLIEDRARRWRWARPFSIATALTLLIAVGWFAVTQRWTGNESVAVLKSTDECRWDAEPLAVGDELRAGQTLRMKTGVAEIQFAGGAS
jgi:hypothetical protein